MTFKIPSDWKQNPDGTYDVGGSVLVKYTDLVDGNLPVKFGKVGGDFDCGGCTDLKSLSGAPQVVGGKFYCWGCTGLTSLLGVPRVVGGDFDCDGCTGLKSLKGIEHTKGIATFYIPPNLKSHVLGLFYTGCTYVKGGEPWVQVVDTYVPMGQKGLVPCSIALVKAGYKALAQL